VQPSHEMLTFGFLKPTFEYCATSDNLDKFCSLYIAPLHSALSLSTLQWQWQWWICAHRYYSVHAL